MLLLLYASSRVGIKRQLRPLAEVSAAVRARLGGELRVRGRLRSGWGAQVECGDVRIVAARGQRVRPELYLVRGEREYRFREVKRPLPEVAEALQAVGFGREAATSPP